MNELAQIVHDLVSGKAPRTDCLASLSSEERAALEDLDSILRHPTDLSERLVAENWLSAPPVITPTCPPSPA